MKVVVTGAGKGIGAALSLKFASMGHEVAICARTESDLQRLASDLSADGRIIFKTCDVRSRAELEDFYQFVHQRFGDIDILINNAGIFLPGQIQDEAPGVFEQLMETNLGSAYHLSRLFLPGMIQRRSGHIFNICSTASITAYTNGGSYCISKFALYGMTKVMREELKPHNIKVTAVLPGATLTNSWSGTDLPETRFMKSEDVANIIYEISQLSPQVVVEEILLRPMGGDIG